MTFYQLFSIFFVTVSVFSLIYKLPHVVQLAKRRNKVGLTLVLSSDEIFDLGVYLLYLIGGIIIYFCSSDSNLPVYVMIAILGLKVALLYLTTCRQLEIRRNKIEQEPNEKISQERMQTEHQNQKSVEPVGIYSQEVEESSSADASKVYTLPDGTEIVIINGEAFELK